MIGPATLVWVSRVVVERNGRCITCRVDGFWVACGELDGEATLIDTRTQKPWAGKFTAEEQAEADALLERAREMRRLDEQRWPRAA